MSQVIKPNNIDEDENDAQIAEETPVKEEFTIRLTPEGQVRLVELLEHPRPLSTVMQKAKETSARLFGAPSTK